MSHTQRSFQNPDALVAHHSVLIFNILGTHEFTDGQNDPIVPPDPEDHHLVRDLWEAYTTAEKR